MIKRPGYTMIELLIILAVTGLLISLGTSSYQKARERQAIRADVEVVLEFLQSSQKEAVIGQKDCSGSLRGIEIVMTQDSSTITKQAICQADSGTIQSTIMQTATVDQSLTFRFRPLDGSTTLPPGTTTVTLESPYGSQTSISISTSGSITNVQN